MTANLLTLNSSKTEFLLTGLKQQLAKIKIRNSFLNTTHSACNLGFIFDEHLTFSDQISALSKSGYSHIHQLCYIRPYLDSKTASIIATSIVHSKLDYCNSLYYNLPKSQSYVYECSMMVQKIVCVVVRVMSSGQGRPLCCEKLLENDRQLMIDAVRVLIKCADCILRSPNDPKFRRLSVADSRIQDCLLLADGAMQCLFEMGFVESDDHFVLPESASLSRVKEIRDALGKLLQEFSETPQSAMLHSGPGVDFARQDAQLVAAFWHQKETEFYAELRRGISTVANYLRPELLAKARTCMPLTQLTERARESCRQLNQSERFVPDHLLIQLLHWFKESFFQWMDSPSCRVCGGSTELSGMVDPLLEERFYLAGRVESYRCEAGCGQFMRFPRYNDPGRLLDTRVGRCGEWANCFTLVCLAAGLDARYVVDWADHVWTEVYSVAGRRWLHADPCENVCDEPLLYESGWGKKISYVIAYSTDDVQDVTWRYTAQPSTVLGRRTACREAWLVRTIVDLRRNIQQQRLSANAITPARLLTLEERTVIELVELMIDNKSAKDNLPGRTTGSEEWRRARGELGTSLATDSHTIVPSETEVENGVLELKYSCARDEYLRVSDNETVVSGWQNLVHEAAAVFRKVEHDWKMTYLARSEGADIGKVVWSFDVGSRNNLSIDRVEIFVGSACFESGCVLWTLTDTQNHREVVSPGCRQVTDVFSGSTELRLTAELSGGNGPTAWQHAQLFRQSLSDSGEYQLDIILHLRSSS